ncbi:MAG: MATE family efflux transporter, partial [Hungatella sp.]
QSFIVMPVFGLTNAMVPIIAYNYGAHKRKRITKTIELSTIASISIMGIGLLIFQILPVQLLSMFNASAQMMEIGVPALRIISMSFLFAGYSIVISSVFQALGNGIYSLIISVARQLVCILPFAYLFAKVWGLHAVWYAFPLSEIIAFLITSYMFKKTYDKTIKAL